MYSLVFRLMEMPGFMDEPKKSAAEAQRVARAIR
jgi:hypothetical protein